MNRLLLSVSILLGSTAIAGAQCQITQSMVSPSRGQIHTEVIDVATGNMMTLEYLRSHVDPTGVYAIIGVANKCPVQGCKPQETPQHACSVSSVATSQFFDWGTAHGGVATATTSLGYSIKDPSGTLVLSQAVLGQKPRLQPNVPCKPQPEPGLPVSTPVLHTMIEGVLVPGQNKVTLGITSVRIYAAKHPGSNNIDFYAQVGVDLNTTFAVEPASVCVTNTDNVDGWYDLYWGVSQNTVSEQLNLGGTAGVILLQQGF